MELIQTSLPGVFLIQLKTYHDSRGWFVESYSSEIFSKLGLSSNFIQDNHSYSERAGTMRGIHFQKKPHSQAKLLRCTRGRLLDVVIDIRKGSPRFAEWEAFTLSDDSHMLLYIPKGMAHGVVSLRDNTELQYKVDSPFVPASESGIRYDDPQLNIDWTISPIISSEKDRNLPNLRQVDSTWLYSY